MRVPAGRPTYTPFGAANSGSPQQGLPALGPLLPQESWPATAVSPSLAAMQRDVSTASPAHLYEVGLTAAAMSYHTAAIEALQDCVAVAPNHALAWRKLAELLRLANEDAQAKAADQAGERALLSSATWKPATDDRSPDRLQKAEDKLVKSLGDQAPEEMATILRERLIKNPLDSVAIRLLAGLEIRAGDQVTAMTLLERALELAPEYAGARDDYAVILIDKGSYAAATVQLARLLAHEPRSLRYRALQAHVTMHIGNYDTALDLLTDILREHPSDSGAWLLYAQALRFLGRYDESVQALRRCLDMKPDMGEAYWALADLKGKFLTTDDMATIRHYLAGDTLDRNARAHMLYALGQGLERAGDFAGSFAAYEEGARLFFGIVQGKAAARPSDEQEPPDSARILRRTKQVFSQRNFATKLAQAPAAPGLGTPLFVVGMPRAGSTLVEQILSSHSLVEGTRELPLIGDITRALTLSRVLVTPNAYPECMLDMSREQLAALGREYLERARAYRITDRPYFVDKRPWNWLQVGLLHMILPHARIIDVRRGPMAAGFAMFKQLLPIEASFSYDLEEIGAYYNKYVNVMEHWDSVLPGRVHFLQYEKLVEDSETEIRRLLDYCGLPFEESCLRYWETDRAVATPSAEQVRRPIFRDALEQWRNFEPWLGPLKEALARPVDL